MKTLFVTSECAPFAKSGGLGDVAGALPEALQAPGNSCRVVLPLYGTISDHWREQMTYEKNYYVTLGWRKIYCGVFTMKYRSTTYYFLDNEQYFKRDRLYGHFDDGERFAFFSRAAAELLWNIDWRPDVIHCNDWQSALVPLYLHDMMGVDESLRDIKTLYTIHNIEYQGRYGHELLGELFGLNEGWYSSGKLEFERDISLMKGAMLTSDAVNTVSPTYAQELHYPYYAYGLDGVVNVLGDKFSGILNGIDTVSYDPSTDKSIIENFSADDISGKAKCKADLQQSLGLSVEPDTPIVACVTRLAAHKGMDLVLARMDALMSLGVQFVVLGTGEHGYEQFFRQAAQRYPGRIAACITFSEDLARRIYAGSDIFLMPSQKEPCGLSQMIAMRYGTIPIVRETGGLKDTVEPYNEFEHTGLGFTFANYNADEMIHVLWLATRLYRADPDEWEAMKLRGMKQDFSWSRSAQDYRKLYQRITGKR